MDSDDTNLGVIPLSKHIALISGTKMFGVKFTSVENISLGKISEASNHSKQGCTVVWM